jgi:hypothetical protein
MKGQFGKIGVILGIVGLLALTGFFTLSRILDTIPGAPGPLTALLHVRNNSVTISDQRPADTVSVRAAALTSPGYVVIYDDEEGPGKRMGVSPRLPKGVTRNLKVPLEHPLAPGYYYAVLEADTGDGAFDPSSKAPLRDAKGDIVMTRFLAADDGSGS